MREKRRKQTLTNKHETIRRAYDYFLQEKRAENLSSDTITIYQIHIRNFLTASDCWDTSTEHFGDSVKDLYQWWIEDLQNDDNKNDVTVASYCRSVRCFIYWLQDNEYMEPVKLKLPRYQRTIKECYTDDELSILLEKPKKCSEVEYQSWVFINLLCATGMRLSSALNIKVAEVKGKEHFIYVQRTKNKKAQIYYVSDEVLSILAKYIIQFDLDDEDYLFCTAERTQLAKRSVQGNIAAYNKSKGVSKTSIHLFRHTFAKNYYIQTKDIYSLCQILGHSSISTTENYLRDLGLNLANATAYNPQVLFAKSKQKKKRRGKMNA